MNAVIRRIISLRPVLLTLNPVIGFLSVPILAPDFQPITVVDQLHVVLGASVFLFSGIFLLIQGIRPQTKTLTALGSSGILSFLVVSVLGTNTSSSASLGAILGIWLGSLEYSLLARFDYLENQMVHLQRLTFVPLPSTPDLQIARSGLLRWTLYAVAEFPLLQIPQDAAATLGGLQYQQDLSLVERDEYVALMFDNRSSGWFWQYSGALKKVAERFRIIKANIAKFV